MVSMEFISGLANWNRLGHHGATPEQTARLQRDEILRVWGERIQDQERTRIMLRQK